MTPETKYRALNEIDKKIGALLPIEGGIFFEAGANDGLAQSNTFYFEEQKGWTGVLVEPILEKLALAKANRPNCICVHAALVGPDHDAETIELVYCNLMSVTNSPKTMVNIDAHVARGTQFLRRDERPYEFSAPARTISSILAEHNLPRVNLMFLDMEGFELEAFRGLDSTRHTVDYICVECRDITAFMAVASERYELMCTLSHHDFFLKARQLAAATALGHGA